MLPPCPHAQLLTHSPLLWECLQGIAGSIPWSALVFLTLYFQLCGMSDAQASGLMATFIGGGWLVGRLQAGWVCQLLGDRSAWRPQCLAPPAPLGPGCMSSWGLILRPMELGRAAKSGEFDESVLIDRPDLPFLNVFLGDMSLVGPRPERPPFVQQFRERVGVFGFHQVAASKHFRCLGPLGLVRRRQRRQQVRLPLQRSEILFVLRPLK